MTRFSEIKEYFFSSLFPLYDRDEIKNFCFLSCEKLLNFSRMDMRLKSEMQLSEDVAKKFFSIVDELLTHKPIQYILGETEFYGLKFLVDENVLIPRQETEELVDWIISQYIAHTKEYGDLERSILDIGTGSGCIPISLKKNISSAAVSALDVSKGALELAIQNASLNNTEINFKQADILNFDFATIFQTNSFDVIVSNPPYVKQSESKLMQKNVLNFEPHLALFVEDAHPLLFYDSIAIFAQKYLKENGKLYFEINESLGNEVVKLLMDKGFKKIEVKKDLNGKDRMVRAEK